MNDFSYRYNFRKNEAAPSSLNSLLLDEWKNGLKDAASNIDGISSKVENEFLGVGQKLRDYNYRVKEIYKLSYETGELISSDSISQAINGLNKILEDINLFINNSDFNSENSGLKFQEIITHLEDCVGYLNGFKRIVKKLRMLGISNRIESSRLKGNFEDFNVLANTVDELSGKIGAKSGDIRVSSENIISIISQNTSRIAKLRERKKDYSDEIIKDTKGTLSVLTNRHSKALVGAKDIIERSETISRDINEIVSSLQFHDITRQKFEHIVEALLDAVKKIENAGYQQDENGALAKETEKTIYIVNGITGLQSAQLYNTQEEFASALGRIMSALTGLSQSVNLMKGKALEIAGAENDTHNSFLIDIEKNLSAAANGMRESGKINEELSISMSSIAETLNNLTSFVDEIDEISSDIELIAVNSNIKSAHTGTEGAALGVLADSIKRLSEDAREQTNTVSNILLEIARLSEEIKKLIKSGINDSETGSSDEITANLGSFLKSLRELSGKIGNNLNLIGEKVLSLSRELDADVKALRAGESVLQATERTLFILEKINKESESYAAGDKSGSYVETLKELESLYTMSSERDIHKYFEDKRKNKSLNINAKLADKAQSAAREAVISEFGDNVELF